MNEKEKAKELVRKFWLIIPARYTPIQDHFESIENETDDISISKKGALIAVDEIIESVPLSPHSGEYYETLGDRVDEVNTYWLNVKSEIEKL